MASGAELTGDGHAANSGAQELDVTTLGERGDRWSPHRGWQGAAEWLSLAGDEETQWWGQELDGTGFIACFPLDVPMVHSSVLPQ
jgi:hypothetical protein